jgi:hypothetical protein
MVPFSLACSKVTKKNHKVKYFEKNIFLRLFIENKNKKYKALNKAILLDIYIKK